MSFFKKFKYLRYIFHTLYFNFHYLPLKQAILFPILLYKPHLVKCKGEVLIRPDNGKIYPGMIRLGFRSVSIYPNSGITWENLGGKIIFNGPCCLGNDTYLSFGPQTLVEFGAVTNGPAGLKIVSYRGLKIGKYCSFGWDCLITDTNIHPLYDLKDKVYKKASGTIQIGNYNWFGTKVKIMHSVITPDHCIFGMGSIITRGSKMKSRCLMGGNPIRILTEDVIRDYNHDYEEL